MTTRLAAHHHDLLSVAPMMEWTDRHYRYMMRLLTKRTKLFTEMYVANTLLFSPNARGFLRFSPEEHPIACQLGGNDPASLAQAARLVEEMGYDEVNLNCGCPSPRVAGKGAFGASLMFSPELVRDCVAAMRAAVSIPVTVKCRLGADDLDSYEDFARFVGVVAEGGCQHFIVHARKCILKGLDPKWNRTVPPLRYPWVQRVALENPHLRFSVNGGLVAWEQVEQLLCLERGVMGEGGGKEEGEGKEAGGGEQQVCPPTFSQEGGGDGEALCCGGEEEEEKKEVLIASAAKEAGEEEGDVAAASAAAADPAGTKPKHDAHIGRLPPTQFLTPGVVPGVESPGTYGGPNSVLSSIMIGRAAYGTPWMFADADRRIFGTPNPGLSRRQVLRAYLDYAEALPGGLPEEERGWSEHRPFTLAKPLINLFQGEYGGGRFRRTLSQGLQDRKLGLREAVEEAMLGLTDEVLDAKMG